MLQRILLKLLCLMTSTWNPQQPFIRQMLSITLRRLILQMDSPPACYRVSYEVIRRRRRIKREAKGISDYNVHVGAILKSLTFSSRQQQADIDISGEAETAESATPVSGLLGEESAIDSSPKLVETNSNKPTVSALDNQSMVTGQEEVSITNVPGREPEPVVESQ